MQKLIALFLMIFCLMMARMAVTAEAPFRAYEGLLIEEIRFEGIKDVADDILCGVLLFGEGDGLNVKDLEESRLALLGLGKFNKAEVEVEQGQQGLVVTFKVQEKWYVMSVPGTKTQPRSRYACKAKPSALDLVNMEGLPIEEIRFEGNRTTREIILREELFFEEGDSFSRESMVKSRQSIQNLSLFKIVEARAERGETGVIVTFSVVEKWYILPIPRLGRNADGDISYGGELRWDNALGLNQQIKLVAEQEDQADGETEQRTFLEYAIAKIPRTPYGVRTKIERKRILTSSKDDTGNTLGQYYAYTDTFNLSVSRWLKRTAPSQGWQGAVGMTWDRDYSSAESGTPELPDDHRQLSLGASGGFTAINDKEFYRAGQEFGGGFSFGRERLGSEENFYNLGAFWRRFKPIHVPIWSNVNFQFRAGFNHGQVDHFELGGSSTMRGILEQDSLNGDVFALLNVEWLIPQPKYPALRWNIFTDIGNAWPRQEVNILRWEKTVGVGARWKIRTFVNTSLRLDIGYNPSTGDYKVYAGTNQMF